MPAIRPIPPSPLRVRPSGAGAPTPPPGSRPQTDLRVAVFDGGVDVQAPQLVGFVRNQDLTAEPEEPDFVAHGTFVTGAALYGPVSAHAALPTPMVSVDHYRVLPVPPQGVWDMDLFWILDRITEVIQASPNYSLVNLSLGPNLTVDVDAEPHVWTATLDELAAEHGTLFVAAGGNNGDLDHQAGLDRSRCPQTWSTVSVLGHVTAPHRTSRGRDAHTVLWVQAAQGLVFSPSASVSEVRLPTIWRDCRWRPSGGVPRYELRDSRGCPRTCGAGRAPRQGTVHTAHPPRIRCPFCRPPERKSLRRSWFWAAPTSVRRRARVSAGGSNRFVRRRYRPR